MGVAERDVAGEKQGVQEGRAGEDLELVGAVGEQEEGNLRHHLRLQEEGECQGGVVTRQCHGGNQRGAQGQEQYL